MTVNVKCDSQLPTKTESHIGRPTHIRGNFFITRLIICTIMELETFRYRATKRHKKSSSCCVPCNTNVALYMYTDYVGMFVKRKRSNVEEREEIPSCLPYLSFLLHSNSSSLLNAHYIYIYIYIYVCVCVCVYTKVQQLHYMTGQALRVPERLRLPDF